MFKMPFADGEFMTSHFLIGSILGVIVELAAAKLGLWRYKHSAALLINIVLMFGGLCGAVSGLFDSPAVMFLVMASIGFCYEWMNIQFLHWWSFLRSDWNGLAICISLGAAWGVAPIVIAYAWQWFFFGGV